MKNRVLSFALVFAVALSLAAAAPLTATAASAPSGWAAESVEEAKELGLATSELLDDFSATTTRLEFCRAAVNLLRIYGYNVDSVTPKMFSDTSDRDIGIAAALGITTGTDTERNLFSPNDPLTREQAATLLNNVLGVIGKRTTGAAVAWTDAASISSWAAQSASDMYNCGVINGTDSAKLVFSPKTQYTHEQSIVTLLRMWVHISPINDTYDPAEYDPADLRPSQNEIVLASDVQSISATREVNLLTSVNEAKRQYTFDNVDASIKNLSVGDKFVIYPCDSVPDGVSIIVSEINISGNRAIITSAEVSLEDIVESMDIAQIVPMTNDMVIDYGDGVTPVSSAATMAASGSVTVEPLTMNLNIPINDSVKVTGQITVAPTLKADIDLHEGWFNIPTGIDYFELSLDNKMQSTLRVEALYKGQIVDMASVYRVQDGALKQKYENYKMTKAKCDAYRQKLFSSAFPIATAPGLQATVTWYLNVTASGQISIEAVYKQYNSFGIKLENGQWSPINTNYSSITVSGAADASVYAGAGIDMGLSYIGVIAASVAPEIGVEVKASTEFNTVLMDSSNTVNDSAHDCALCVDGDINLKLSLNANVDAIGFGNILSKELLSNTTKFGDFYYTLGGSSHDAEFGWSECPYINGPNDSAKDVTSGLDLVGDSFFDPSDNSILLCPAITWSSGNAYFRDYLSDNFNIEFEYKIGGGTGADGIVFAFFTIDSIPTGVGEYLNFDGSEGYGIEFDTYRNTNDSSNPHVALIHEKVSTHLISVDDARVRDNQWHTANVNVNGDRVVVQIDGDTVIDYTGNIDRTNRCMYFAASTGASTDNHYIRNVVLTEPY